MIDEQRLNFHGLRYTVVDIFVKAGVDVAGQVVPDLHWATRAAGC